MLSICIPIFEQNVSHLVKQLQQEVAKHTFDVEILLLEDGSTKTYEYEGVRHEYLSKNVGRAAARNHLARRAKGSYLLFLDADSSIIRADFLKKYVQEMEQKTLVCCGGRLYPKDVSPEKVLHHTFGIKREKNIDNQVFISNNFLINIHIFNAISFNEQLRHYGHEDTLFGFELSQKNIPIKRIDNPVLHLDLCDNALFLAKTEQAIDNLLLIWRNGMASSNEKFVQYVKLLRTAIVLKKLRLSSVINLIFNPLHKAMKKYLITNKCPNIYILDLYKLTYILDKIHKTY